jgi:NAD(P)-dependent dehydrogenase (short-subunit alcohol dehydrogenase family)
MVIVNETRSLAGRTVLITGASGGLGHHFSRLLAEAGACIAACGRRTDKLDGVVTGIKQGGGVAEWFEMDVMNCSSIERAVAAAEDALGPIHVLINNSGTSLAKDAVEVSEAEYDMIMDTNPKGSYFTATKVAKRMIDHGIAGSIINISSVAASRPIKQRSVYCISKAAIDHMTRVLALEWARYNIRVNAIAPGWLATEDNAKLFERADYQAYLERFPRQRLGKPEHLDVALMLLATPAGDFITGQSILVDDGYSLSL